MDANSRTGHYWMVWEERQGRWQLRAISRGAVLATLLLALLAASAGVLIALTQKQTPWVGLVWAAWILAVAVIGGRVLGEVKRGFIRHSGPIHRHLGDQAEPRVR